MKRPLVILIALGLTVGVGSLVTARHESPPAQFDRSFAFLELEGVPGETASALHRDGIDVVAFDLGAARMPSQGGGGPSPKADFGPLRLVLPFDKSAPLLLERIGLGTVIPTALLTLRRADGFEYVKIRVDDVVVIGFTVDGMDPNTVSLPTVAIELDYAKIRFDYIVQNADGTAGPVIHGGWDVATSRRA